MTDTSRPAAPDATMANRNDPDKAGVKILAGLAAGVIGVWALDRVDWFMWNREDPAARAQTTAVRPDGEPPAQALVSKIEGATGKNVEPATHEAVSQAVHYAIGIVPAIGYALLRDRLPMTGVTRGALYGIGLFLMQDEMLNTLAGLGAKPQRYPWQAHARGIVAHTVYGVTTELALNIFDKGAARRTLINA
ncbi:hypothetical protein GCM10007973_30640 [Polymorphobacter multimanifer]|uniref:Putative membrane protein YagU involved in acid resistance n=1 Tax=Polymorphobacter multimanifer TaxID=1070431 RepID=A0A841LJR5_9SPHN|nr:DUF1440 domain-containing protein [Polymorphobacter multimanifer]MBB6229472.1 putative membrane protein YagU involved in acid resistance [Polymorphobacter multimanifer]GGI92309.1 hypothetical protein GCM10007973_30640 [Polymorphobacter multimanifer]